MDDLVFAFVAPIGTDLERFEATLKTCLASYNCNVTSINVTSALEGFLDTSLINKVDRLENKIAMGNKARKLSKDEAILAKFAVSQVNSLRVANNEKKKNVYLIRQLKKPEELKLLKDLYQQNFFLIGITATEVERLKNMTSDCYKDSKDSSVAKAKELFNVDNDEQKDTEAGQKVVKIFSKSDVFFSDNSSHDSIHRFLDLIYSSPFVSPTKSEIHMNLAFSASLKSIDLSRQVGSVIVDDAGNVMSTGSNDVPKFGGGQYSDEDLNKHPDWKLGFDPNKKNIDKIIHELEDDFREKGILNESNKLEIRKILKDSTIDDITEYVRAIHAEMEAILSCGRQGKSTQNKIMYCTTFPCHNCAKHIVGSGIKEVFYIEPYAKSLALNLHGDSITFNSNDPDKVKFTQFIGIGPSRFNDLFSLLFTTGKKIKRKDDAGKATEYTRNAAEAKFKYLDYQFEHLIKEEEKIAKSYGILFDSIKENLGKDAA